jgi:hypothetical protein
LDPVFNFLPKTGIRVGLALFWRCSYCLRKTTTAAPIPFKSWTVQQMIMPLLPFGLRRICCRRTHRRHPFCVPYWWSFLVARSVWWLFECTLLRRRMHRPYSALTSSGLTYLLFQAAPIQSALSLLTFLRHRLLSLPRLCG